MSSRPMRTTKRRALLVIAGLLAALALAGSYYAWKQGTAPSGSLPGTFTAPGSLSHVEQQAWTDLDMLLRNNGIENPLVLHPEGARVTLGESGESYERNSPRSLLAAMASWARQRATEHDLGLASGEDPKPAEELINLVLIQALDFTDMPRFPEIPMPRLRQTAARFAVLGFLFGQLDEIEIAEKLAARAMALEACAQASDATIRPSPALTAVLALALGRPDEADRELASSTSSSPLDVALLNFVWTRVSSRNDTALTGPNVLNMLTRARDNRPFDETDLEPWFKSAGNADLVLACLAPEMGVAAGHIATRIIWQRASEQPAVPPDKDAFVAGIKTAWRRQGFLARYRFLNDAYASPDDAAKFLENELAYRPADPYLLARQLAAPELKEDDVEKFAQLIPQLPTLSARRWALDVLEDINEVKARQSYAGMDIPADDSNAYRLTEQWRMQRALKLTSEADLTLAHLLALDPGNAWLYARGDQLLLESGIARLPGSYRLLNIEAQRLADGVFYSETGTTSAIAVLESGRVSMADEPGLLLSAARYWSRIGRMDTAVHLFDSWLSVSQDQGLRRTWVLSRSGIGLLQLGQTAEGLDRVEKAARSHAEWALLPYAYLLEHAGRKDDALKLFEDCAQRYPQDLIWVDHAECLRRLGRNEEADAIYRKRIAALPNSRSIEKLLEYLYRVRPERIVWAFDQELLKLQRSRDYGALALAHVLMNKPQLSMAVLGEAEREGKLNDVNTWFQFILTLAAKGPEDGRAFLRAHRGEFKDEHHRIVLAVALGDSDAESLLTLRMGERDEKSFLAILLPVAAFLANAEGRHGEAARWFDRACRLNHESRLLIAARHARGLPPGDYWAATEPSRSALRRIGLPAHAL